MIDVFATQAMPQHHPNNQTNTEKQKQKKRQDQDLGKKNPHTSPVQ